MIGFIVSLSIRNRSKKNAPKFPNSSISNVNILCFLTPMIANLIGEFGSNKTTSINSNLGPGN